MSIPIALAELKARGAVGLRSALIWYELRDRFPRERFPNGELRTELGAACSAAGLATLLCYAPRAFANSLKLLCDQGFLLHDSQGCYSLAKLPDDSNCPRVSQSVPKVSQTVPDKNGTKTGHLLDLPEIPEQRKQRNRNYSSSQAAIRKRRQRAKSLGQTGQKVPQTVPKLSNFVPAANIVNINHLAVRPSAKMREYLAQLGLDPAELSQPGNPPPPEQARQLDSLGIPHSYYQLVLRHYMPTGVLQILGELYQKRDSKNVKKYVQQPNLAICTFLRWLIRAQEGDKYGKITLHKRLTNSSPGQLMPLPPVSAQYQTDRTFEPPSELSDQSPIELLQQIQQAHKAEQQSYATA